MERLPRKCFGCGSEDHMIAKCPKPPKDNDKRRRQVRFNEIFNRACDSDEKTMTIRYTHLWHECLAISNVQVKNMVTGRN